MHTSSGLTSHSLEFVAEFHRLTMDWTFQPSSYQLQFEGKVAAMKRQGGASRQGFAARHSGAQWRAWDPRLQWREKFIRDADISFNLILKD